MILSGHTPLQKLSLPLMQDKVPAGFPSPAADSMERTIDLNDHLVTHPAATFIVRVSGDSMTGAGIFDGDLAVVDRSLVPHHNDIVIAVINGEMTVKRLSTTGRKIMLKPENPNYPPIMLHDDSELVIWGVVSSVIRQLRRT